MKKDKKNSKQDYEAVVASHPNIDLFSYLAVSASQTNTFWLSRSRDAV